MFRRLAKAAIFIEDDDFEWSDEEQEGTQEAKKVWTNMIFTDIFWETRCSRLQCGYALGNLEVYAGINFFFVCSFVLMF